MDLKTALKDILPRLMLKVRHKPGSDKWPIDRPIEFRECYTCKETVDERIFDCCMHTNSEENRSEIIKTYNKWCIIHNAPEIIEACSKSKPCKRCYRWFIPKLKKVSKIERVADKETSVETIKKTIMMREEKVCWMCRHNPWSVMPVPDFVRRPWFIAPVEVDE